MKISSRLFSLSKNTDSLLAALSGFFLILIFSKHSGIGISPDSVTYLSSARHLVQGKGFFSFDGLPTVDFPFAYPFFLSVISFISGLDPLRFASWLNGILFGLLIYCSGAMMNGFPKSSGWYKRIILLCILSSPALLEVYSMLWSETAFLLLILFFIVAIAKYLQERTLKWILISAFVCALTCITRYAGVFLVFTGTAILFFNTGNNWRKRISDCCLFGTISLSLLLINIIRNVQVTGHSTGLRLRSHTGIFKVLEYFGGVISDWLLLNRTPVLGIFLSVFVLLIFLFVIILSLRRKYPLSLFPYVVALTGLTYSLFMVISFSVTRYEQFTSRLIAPVFIPLLWSISGTLPGFISGSSFRLKTLTGMTALILAAVFLNVQLRADYEFYDGVKDAGVPGYQEDPFVHSDIVQFIKANKTIFNDGSEVYSNAADAFYFVTGSTARQLPVTDFPLAVRAYYATGNSGYLVWFSDLINPDMPDLQSILANRKMALLKQFKDGAVYISR